MVTMRDELFVCEGRSKIHVFSLSGLHLRHVDFSFSWSISKLAAVHGQLCALAYLPSCSYPLQDAELQSLLTRLPAQPANQGYASQCIVMISPQLEVLYSQRGCGLPLSNPEAPCWNGEYQGPCQLPCDTILQGPNENELVLGSYDEGCVHMVAFSLDRAAPDTAGACLSR